jgi:hypothetical protein
MSHEAGLFNGALQGDSGDQPVLYLTFQPLDTLTICINFVRDRLQLLRGPKDEAHSQSIAT